MTTRETILAAFAKQLAAVASGRVYRTRRDQLPDLPAVIIEPESATTSEIVLGAMDHELAVSVAIYAKGGTPDNAADATLLAAHAAVIIDRSLGLGNGVQVRPEFEAEWNFDDYDYVKAIHHYHVTYRTTGNDF